MARARGQAKVRPEKIGGFLDAAYDMDADDQTWLAGVMEAGRAVWGRGGPAHGAIYDASDVNALRLPTTQLIGFSEGAADCVMRGVHLVTPGVVTRTFRALFAAKGRQAGAPELLPMFEEMSSFGYPDHCTINGLDPAGLGAFFALWESEARTPPPAEVLLYRRMAHHLGAAYRCRRRLRESQAARSRLDPTEGAEAILDARRRIVHATGLAQAKDAQRDLIETAEVRDQARRLRADAHESLGAWRPLTRARWTLVDSFEHGGARYIVARENQASVEGLEGLTDRERQAVVYLAVGQSTKETAYALGISDVTVRVLLGRAATKLGVRSRAGLLDHPEVRLLCPDRKA